MKHNFLKTAFVIAVLALFVIVGGSLSEATTLTTINVEMAGLEAAASMAAAIAIDPETLASAQLPDEQTSHALTISNTGQLTLNWSIEEAGGVTAVPIPAKLVDLPALNDRAQPRIANETGAPARPVLPAATAPLTSSWSENFDDVTLLPGLGWAMINKSEPLGANNWGQGNPINFPAHAGAPNSYIAASYQSTTGGDGVISNWLLTPEIVMNNYDTLTFWTRNPGAGWPDRLQVRVSPNGGSVDVGSSAYDVGDFTILLLDINPDYEPLGYPFVWTEITVAISGLTGPTNGRIAFRYFVESAGPLGDNSDYVGIDTLAYTAPCVSPSAVSWLSVDPDNGSTLPGASTPVTVTLDSTGLPVGVYTAHLCVNSDDPANPTVQVPVTMDVNVPSGPPIIDVSPMMIDTAVAEGSQTNQILTIGNSGEADLNWFIEEAEGSTLTGAGGASAGGSACDSPSNVDWLVVTPDSGVAPGGETSQTLITLNATALSAGTYTAYLCVNSDDPDNPLVTVPVTLEVFTPPDPAVITLDPESVTAAQLIDTQTTHTINIGNMGEADLEWVFGTPTALYDNGPFITSYGDGPGGADVSLMQNVSLGFGTFGYHVGILAGGPSSRIAEDFTVTDPGGWYINQIRVYGYQVGTTTTSTLIGVNYRIWDGLPGVLGSAVIYGDTTTNRMSATDWTNVYRVAEDNLGGTTRPLMYADSEAGLHLPPGTYWLDWQLAGSGLQGPWQPPVTILGEATTGNARHLQPTGWNDMMDEDTDTQQGAPFQLWLETPAVSCDDPSAVSWLSLSLDNGLTPSGGSAEVVLTLDSTGLTAGLYTATLCILSNDPDAPLSILPVSLTVSQMHYLYLPMIANQ